MHYYYDSTSNDAALLLSEKLKYIIKIPGRKLSFYV